MPIGGGEKVSGQDETETLLNIKDLSKYFSADSRLFSKKTNAVVKAVDHINFQVKQEDVFGIVGESGCGKTTVLKMLLQMIEPTSGEILFHGDNILTMNKERKRQYRGKVQTVMQDPYSSLSPRMRIRDIISEPMEIQRKDMTKKQRMDRVNEMLTLVKLSPEAGNNYPHEFSGGQRQRIAIARALSLQPELVLLDEPVSALDVSVQAQLMNDLMDIRDKTGITYVVVAHNLAVIRFMCNRMMVMYLGQVMEYGDCETIFKHTYHPYTQALFHAALSPDPRKQNEGKALSGELPSPIDMPSGCHFHTRCPYATEKCSMEEPVIENCGEGHIVKCHYWKNFQKAE